MKRLWICFAVTFALSVGVNVAYAATTRFVSPAGNDTGDCSVTACKSFTFAISQAAAGDTISAAAGTYNELSIIINIDLTIIGAGQDATIIDAGELGSPVIAVFSLTGSITGAISDLTIQNSGEGTGDAGGIENFISSTLTLARVTIRNNTGNGGGGILNDGHMSIQDSLIGGADNVLDGNKTLDSDGGGISNSGELTLDNTTVSGNSTEMDPEVDQSCAGNGGGISNGLGATLTINNSTISGNIAKEGAGCGGLLDGNGGGIFNNAVAKITIDHSVIEANQAANDTSLLPITGGGGIYNAGGDITIRNGSTINGNFAVAGDTTNPSSGARGGGIFHTSGDCNSSTPCPTPNLTVSNSTISNNASFSDGGGIYRDNPMTLTNVTVSGNTAVSGEAGGIYNNGVVGGCLLQSCPGTLINVTVANNKALNTGGISADNTKIPTILKNTLIAQNIQTSDNTNANCAPSDTALSSKGHNLSDDATCTNFFTQVGSDFNSQPAGIGPLADNGGNYPSNPPFTHALLTGSKAIDAIPAADCTDSANAALIVDERNLPRPGGGFGPNCDIGAFELQATPIPTLAPTPVATPLPSVLPQFLEGSGSSCSLSTAGGPNGLPILAGLLFAPVLLRGLLRKWNENR